MLNYSILKGSLTKNPHTLKNILTFPGFVAYIKFSCNFSSFRQNILTIIE